MCVWMRRWVGANTGGTAADVRVGRLAGWGAGRWGGVGLGGENWGRGSSLSRSESFMQVALILLPEQSRDWRMQNADAHRMAGDAVAIGLQ